MLPIGPTATEVTTRVAGAQGCGRGVDYNIENLTRVWVATNDEDRQVVEENQRGINSPAYVPGLLEDPGGRRDPVRRLGTAGPSASGLPVRSAGGGVPMTSSWMPRPAGARAWKDDEPLGRVSVVPDGPGTVSFSFRSLAYRVRFRPGQFLTLELSVPGAPIHRTATISSALAAALDHPDGEGGGRERRHPLDARQPASGHADQGESARAASSSLKFRSTASSFDLGRPGSRR